MEEFALIKIREGYYAVTLGSDIWITIFFVNTSQRISSWDVPIEDFFAKETLLN